MRRPQALTSTVTFTFVLREFLQAQAEFHFTYFTFGPDLNTRPMVTMKSRHDDTPEPEHKMAAPRGPLLRLPNEVSRPSD